jgi:hypothetical protein
MRRLSLPTCLKSGLVCSSGSPAMGSDEVPSKVVEPSRSRRVESHRLWQGPRPAPVLLRQEFNVLPNRLQRGASFQEKLDLLHEPAPHPLLSNAGSYYLCFAIDQAHIYQIRQVEPGQIALSLGPKIVQ